MDNELETFRLMFNHRMGITETISKPRRDEREWKDERRLKRRAMLRLKLGKLACYRKEFRPLLYKKNSMWT